MPVIKGLEGIMENRRLMRTIKGVSGNVGIYILSIGLADEGSPALYAYVLCIYFEK